jgi:hypothetical protein
MSIASRSSGGSAVPSPEKPETSRAAAGEVDPQQFEGRAKGEYCWIVPNGK